MLVERGHEVSGQLLMLLLPHLELHGLVCSGAAGGRRAHLRADGRPGAVTATARPRGGARRARAALLHRARPGHRARPRLLGHAHRSPTCAPACAQVRDRLDSFEHDGRTFWHAPDEVRRPGRDSRAAHLLQILDETYRGYQDTRWVLDADGHRAADRETAIGMALVDAQLVAAMKRTVAPDHVRFELRPYRPVLADDVAALEAAASEYGHFLGRVGMLELR